MLFVYTVNSVLIALVLFALILAANEAGYRFGRGSRPPDEGRKSQTTAIQAAMLGLLALLLGFTFTMALQRFDQRSEAVIVEANAIGTAALRGELLPGDLARQARALLGQYVDLRLRAGDVDLAHQEQRREAHAAAGRLQQQLWTIALRASEADPRPTTTGLFIQAVNDLIDAYGRRHAALQKHVPQVVFILLFAVFVIAGAILGYAGGLMGSRPLVATVAMAMLIVLVIFLIIDLDRPRRGLIRVSQDSMLDVAAALAAP